MTAPPTAREALAMLAHLPGQTEGAPKCCVVAHATLRAFIEHAAAEADAWVKIEAWQAADEFRHFVLDSQDYFTLDLYDHGTRSEFSDPTRLAALQLAAAWCEKEGA